MRKKTRLPTRAMISTGLRTLATWSARALSASFFAMFVQGPVSHSTLFRLAHSGNSLSSRRRAAQTSGFQQARVAGLFEVVICGKGFAEAAALHEQEADGIAQRPTLVQALPE